MCSAILLFTFPFMKLINITSRQAFVSLPAWWRGVPDTEYTHDVQYKGEEMFETEVKKFPINTLVSEGRESWA